MGKVIVSRRGGGGLEGTFNAVAGWYPDGISSMSTKTFELASAYKYALIFTTGTTSDSKDLYKARITKIDFEKQQTSIVAHGSWTAPVVSVSGHTITIEPHGSYCAITIIGIE